MLDIVGSLAIRASIVIIMINLSLTMRDTLYQKSSAAATYQNLSTVADMMYKDIRRTGNDTTLSNPFLTINSKEIRFLVYRDSTLSILDTLDYRLDSILVSGVYTPVIWRTRNSGNSLQIAKGPISLKIVYLDSLANSTLDPDVVQSIDVVLTSTDVYQPPSSSTTAIIRKEFRVFPPNL